MRIRTTALACLLASLSTSAIAADDGTLPVFDLHFAVVSGNLGPTAAATLEQLRREVDILNTYFVALDRSPIVRFRFKSASLHADIKDSRCDFVRHGDLPQPFDSRRAERLFNACDDTRVRDPRAINVYVYDSYAERGGFADVTSHGRRNSNRPYLLLDWERLNHKVQGAEEHEMGHAFGLEHVCAPGAKPRTSTNIMASADCGLGSGGLRDLGFDEEQVRTIRQYAGRIRDRLSKH